MDTAALVTNMLQAALGAAKGHAGDLKNYLEARTALIARGVAAIAADRLDPVNPLTDDDVRRRERRHRHHDPLTCHMLPRPLSALRIFAALLALVGLPIGGFAEEPKLDRSTVTEGMRGQQIVLTGTNLPTVADGIRIKVGTIDVPSGSISVKTETPPAPPAPDPKAGSLTFRIPQDAELGQQTIRITFLVGENKEERSLTVSTPADKNFLKVIGDQVGQLELESVAPLVSYPTSEKRYAFTVLGQGFSRRGKDNKVRIENQELSIAWDDTPKEANEDAAKTVYVGKGHVVSDRELRISDFDKGTFRAPMKLSVRVGDVVSKSVPITFATVDEDFPRNASIWLVIGLLVLVAFIMLAGTRRKQIPGEPKIGFIGSFLLDPETDTYSLSKLQFYLWTFAGIFGYCFLTLCLSLIQGHFELAEIPDGLPGIIGASAGTSILATGITSARGPKGAGPVHPGFADFFTSGGVVAPERFQFFIWTLVGVASFVGMIALYDPASVTGLPKIPPGFLYMMGISSAGYLGGKFVRKPGPVIDSIDAQYGSLKLEIRGRNLSKDASYRIGDKEISYKLETGTTQLTAADEVQKDATLKIITKEEDPNAETFAKVVLLTIAAPEQAWVTGKKDLTIVNPDGQKAVWPFEVPKAVIKSITLSATGTELVITGSGFGASAGNSTISVNDDVPAVPKNWNDSTITLPQPATALKKDEKAKIVLNIDGHAQTVEFIVA